MHRRTLLGWIWRAALAPIAFVGTLACDRRPAQAPDRRSEGDGGTREAKAADEAAALVTALERELGYLRLEPGGLEAFVHDFLTYRSEGVLRSLPHLDLPRRYLLSSDFFDHDGDEERTVDYVVFYDPYVTPCSNRLASLGGREDEPQS